MKMNQVAGSHNVGKVALFALSTCGWCKKARQLLDSNSVAYEYIYVDLAQGAEKDEVMAELRKYKSHQGFPTTIVNGEVIIGYDEARLRQVLKL